MAQPLTDAITALTRYANETTGASDTTLSDAVRTLCDGYGGGGGYSIDEIIERSAITGDITYSGSVSNLPVGALSETSITSFVSESILNNSYGYAFRNCKSLKSVNLPNFSPNTNSQCSYMFEGCSALEDIKIPKFKRSAGNIFQNCSSLKMLVLPKVNYALGMYFANGCSSLETVDLGGDISGNLCTGNGFSNSGLKTLILRRTGSILTTSANNFSNSPFADGGTGGTLYVPQDLISRYQSATNWSTILGYANNQILPIEGSIYETQYADGTPIE